MCFYITEGDDCASNPCMNDGVCKDGPSNYTCICSAEYNGTHCELGNYVINPASQAPLSELQLTRNIT